MCDEMSRRPKKASLCWLRLVYVASRCPCSKWSRWCDTSRTRQDTTHTHERGGWSGGPMAESAGADLLTVVRRLPGWYSRLSCSENSAGGGWSRQKQRFLWSHQSGPAALGERIDALYVGDDPACSSPVVSVPAPVSGYPRQISCFGPPFGLLLVLFVCLRAC